MPPPHPTGAASGTAGSRSAGAACGGGGGGGTGDGVGCVDADCSRFKAGAGHVVTGGGRAAVVPEKAAVAFVPAAVGREAARSRPGSSRWWRPVPTRSARGMVGTDSDETALLAPQYKLAVNA